MESITRTTERARHGIASLQVVTQGEINNEGCFYRVSDLAGISEVLTFSAYVRGNAVVRLRMQAGAFLYVGRDVRITDDRWTRIELTGMHSGTDDVRLYIETGGNGPQAVTFYVDSVQLERKPYATTYCDGDQPGCRWNVLISNSNSSRDGYTRQGGRWVTLAGDGQEEDLYVTSVGGLGVPPISNNVQSFSQSPGGYLQNAKVQSRLVTFSFHAKKKRLGQVCENSLSSLHKLRSYLLDLVKPDRTAGAQEFTVEYTDGDAPIYFTARYDGGMEGEWDTRNGWINSFPLRLLVTSPMLFEDDQEVAVVNFVESFPCSAIAGKINGRWSNLNGGLNFSAGDIEIGRTGQVYVSGPSIHPYWGTAYWDGDRFQSISGEIKNISVNDIAVAPNGDIYITGPFTTIGSMTVNRVAKWNGVAWSALGTGLNAAGLHVSVAPNGDVYVAGQFTTAGGVSCNRIARWDGSSWFPLGAYSGLNGDVQSIAISKDGTYMFIGGDFTDQATLATNALMKVAKYTVSSNSFSAVGSGFDLMVLEVILSPSGTLYACGSFTLSGATQMKYISMLQGNTWIPLSSGMNATVRSMDISPSGELIAVGDFTQAGGVDCYKIALWNGSAWVAMDAVMGGGFGSPTILGVQHSPGGDMYIGGQQFATNQSKFSAITSIENVGTAEVSPFMYILGPGKLRWLENRTSKKRVYFNLNILTGEEVFIYFGQGKIESTIRGDLSFAVLPGSDFGSFTLLPGENEISTFMTNDVNSIIRIGYTPTHWSVDATKRD